LIPKRASAHRDLAILGVKTIDIVKTLIYPTPNA